MLLEIDELLIEWDDQKMKSTKGNTVYLLNLPR